MWFASSGYDLTEMTLPLFVALWQNERNDHFSPLGRKGIWELWKQSGSSVNMVRVTYSLKGNRILILKIIHSCFHSYSTKDETQGLIHARQVLCHWASSPVWVNEILDFFIKCFSSCLLSHLTFHLKGNTTDIWKVSGFLRHSFLLTGLPRFN